MQATIDPAAFYATTIEYAERTVQRLDRDARRVELARILLAVAGFVVWALRAAMPPAVLWTLTLIVAAAFVWSVRYHRRLRNAAMDERRRLFAARAGRARVILDWYEMPPMRSLTLAPGWPRWVAHDLDVVGDRSLMRLLDSTSRGGLERLSAWMLDEPASVEEIADRQRSVADVRQRAQLLLDVAAETRFAGADTHAALPDGFAQWCQASGERSTATMQRLSWLPIVFVVVAASVMIAGQWTLASALVNVFVLTNIGLSMWAQRRLRTDLAQFERALGFLRSTQRLLELTARADAIDGKVGAIQKRMVERQAQDVLRSLLRLLEWAEVRRSPMMHWALNAVIGFDMHVAHRMDTWRARHAAHVPGILDDMADAGALFTLGIAAFERHTWTMPTVHNDETLPRFAAVHLAHPLLPASKAVANDASLHGAGDVIVVSGANMAGKSTFLRAIGLNTMLAQAGGVVAVASLQVHRCRLRSSIHVEDDLGSGVSLFLAEVTRVKRVIDEARDISRPPVLFLLDEVLHGTNAKDRRSASQQVLHQLRATNAVGVIATHDPVIGEEGVASSHEHAPQQWHFACRVEHSSETGKIELVFDYRARPGPATESNALYVLELLGLSTGTHTE